MCVCEGVCVWPAHLSLSESRKRGVCVRVHACVHTCVRVCVATCE